MALQVGELFATLNLDDSPFSKGLSKTGSLFAGGVKGMAKAATALTAAFGAASIGAVKSIAEVGSSFESAMSEVQAISGATGDELEQLTETAKEYGRTTAFTATESAEALKYMALAGWDATESTEALPGVLNLAAASGMDLATASDMVTDYISAFGMECGDATYLADMMAKALATSNTSAQQLGEAYGNCAATLHAAGQDVETTTSLLMTMANQGLKGSEAGTALSAVMRDITSKMDNGAIAIGNTSVQVQDAQGNFRDLTDILYDVQAATEGMGSAEKSAALMSTFTARSLKGINLILNEGTQAAADYEASLRGATGTGSEQASMMLDNLQGDVKLFQSALEGLQIDAYDSMNGMMRSAVQGATEVITQLQTAFNEGFSASSLEGVLDSTFDLLGDVGGQVTDMLLNLSDAFTEVAPKLTKSLANGLKDVLGKVGKQIPKLAKNLFAALPDVLSAAGDLIPSLADSLFETIGGALEQVITDLPRLIPALTKGIGNLFTSVFDGLAHIGEGIDKGIWNLMGEMGWRDLTVTEQLQKQIDSIDTSNVDKIIDGGLLTYEFETKVDPGDYQTKINEAVQTIHDALANVPSLSEDQRSAIEKALLAGSGADVLETVLSSLNIPDPSGATAQITTAFTTISTALEGVELSETAKTNILNIAASGGDVEAALKSYGVDPGVASTTAQSIQQAWSTLSTDLSDLGLDSGTIMQIFTNASGDRASILSALNLLKLPQGTIDSIMASYDVSSGTLTGQFSNVVSGIGKALTNGIPDDPEQDPDLKQAKTDLDNYIQSAYDKLVEWRDSKLAELDASGLTGDALTQAKEDVMTTFTDMNNELNELGNSAVTFLDENAGQATSVVQEHMGTLDEIAARADELNGRIDALGAKLESGYSANRSGVESGAITNQHAQIEALNYTAQEYEYAAAQAAQRRDTAIQNAFGPDSAKTITDAENAYDAEMERAAKNQQLHMDRTWAGILSSTPGFNGNTQLMNFADAYKDYDIAGQIMQAIQSSVASGQPINGDEVLAGLDVEPADLSEFAGKLGIDNFELARLIEQSVTEGADNTGNSNWFTLALQDYINNGLDGVGISSIDTSGLATLIYAAIEEGLITVPEGTDIDTFVNNYIQDILGNLTFDENGKIVIPPLEPELSTPPVDTSNLTGAQDTVNQTVDKNLPDSTEEKTVEAPINVEPTVANDPGGDAETEVETAADTVSETAPTKTVDMKMDLNASVGSISFSEGNSVTDKLQALFTDQTIPMVVNIDVTKGTLNFSQDFFKGSDIQTGVIDHFGGESAIQIARLPVNITIAPGSTTLASDSDFTATVTSLLTGSIGSIPLGADITVTPGSVTLTEGTDISTTISALIPSPGAIPLSADISVTPGSVTLSGATDIASTVAGLMPAISTIPLTTDISVTPGSVTLSGGTDIASTVSGLMPAIDSIPLSADASVSIGSVTLAGNTDLASTVSGLMAGKLGAIPLSANASVSLTVTDSNATSLGTSEGEAMGTAVGNGLRGSTSTSAVNSAAAVLASSAVSALQGTASRFTTAGRNFASGLASGIRSGRSAVVNAAAQVAAAAAQAAQSTLQIHSPSKVMAWQGAMFDQGFAKGIDKSAYSIVRSAGSLAAMAANAATVGRLAPRLGFNSTQTGTQAVQPIDYDALADAMNQRDMVLTMKDRAVAEVLTNETARTQSRRSRRVALGYGK